MPQTSCGEGGEGCRSCLHDETKIHFHFHFPPVFVPPPPAPLQVVCLLLCLSAYPFSLLSFPCSLLHPFSGQSSVKCWLIFPFRFISDSMLSCFSSRCSFCCWDCGFASRSHNKNLVHPSFMANGVGIEMGMGKGQGERVRGSSCVDSRTSQLVAPRCIYITFLSALAR